MLQMSIENLKKYGKMCSENEEIHKKAKEIGTKDLEGQIAYAKSLGLEISREDFESLAREVGLEGKNELSEDDLKKVAGGIITVTGVAALAAIAGGVVVGGSVGAAAVEGAKW
jgi:predicted ribosomally synthesized peptide with nif11-like leader